MNLLNQDFQGFLFELMLREAFNEKKSVEIFHSPLIGCGQIWMHMAVSCFQMTSFLLLIMLRIALFHIFKDLIFMIRKWIFQ